MKIHYSTLEYLRFKFSGGDSMCITLHMHLGQHGYACVSLLMRTETKKCVQHNLIMIDVFAGAENYPSRARDSVGICRRWSR